MLVPYRGGQYAVAEAGRRVHPLVGVADLLWRNRDRLSTGFRKLWSLLPGWSSRASKPRARKGGRRPLVGASKDFANWQTGAPVSVGNITSSPVWMDLDRAPQHFAGPGIRLFGRQLVCALQATNTTDDGFATMTGGATLVSGHVVRIGPDSLNGRIAIISKTFSRFIFRHVRFVHITRSATSTTGGFAMALIQDPEAIDFAGTTAYADLIQVLPSVAGPGWANFSIEADNHTDELLWTELDAATDAGARQTSQYALLGAFDSVASGTVQVGEVFIEYVLDLYCPSFDYGFTLAFRIRTREECDFLREQQRLWRLRADADRAPSRLESRASSWHDPSGEIPTSQLVSAPDGRFKPR